MGRVIKKIKKKKTVAKLKKECDAIYSQWLRLSNADHLGNVTCYTCDKYAPWKTMQCGHYISRRWNLLRFDERNTKIQCVGCNLFKAGASDTYALNLIRDYGEGILQELDKLKVSKTFTTEELEELIALYKERFKECD